MDEHRKPSLTAFLPQVAAATLAVAVLPSLVVWVLRSAGLVQSVGASVALGTVLALAASYIGNVYWKSRAGAGDLLFSELMVWGWVRRWRMERRLASTALLLDGVTDTEELGNERRKELLLSLASALEAQDPYTHGHSRRVARHAAAIARQLGLPGAEIARVRTAAALHDVGKLDTPRPILRKPSPLSDEEFAVIKRHPALGAAMVAPLGDAELADVVRHHHERIDGTGYPDGLAGEEIPLAARIIAVADTFDAITSSRPYRPASSHKQALEVLAGESGTQLDPSAVRAFQSFYVGRKPLAVWAVLTSIPERIVSSFSGGINVAAGSIARVAAASAVTTAAAVGAISSPLVGGVTQTIERSASLSPSVSAAVAAAARSPVHQQLSAAPPAASAVAGGGLAAPAGARGTRTAAKRPGAQNTRLQTLGAHGGAASLASSSGAGVASMVTSSAQTSGSSQSSAAPMVISVSPGQSGSTGSAGSHSGGSTSSHGNGNGASHGNGNGVGNGASRGNGAGASHSNGNGKGNGNGPGNGASRGNGAGASHSNGNGNGPGSSAGSGQSASGGQGHGSTAKGQGNDGGESGNSGPGGSANTGPGSSAKTGQGSPAKTGQGSSAKTGQGSSAKPGQGSPAKTGQGSSAKTGQGSSAAGTTTAANQAQANANSNGHARVVASGNAHGAGSGSAGH